MNKNCFLILVLFLLSGVSFAQVNISEIQYTIDPGDGTYPSPLFGQNVTTGGIVTATNYDSGNYFISSSNGGAWQGIFVYDVTYAPEIGDSIIISGEVYEFYGFTEVKNLINIDILSNSNPLPIPEQLSTYDLFNEEAYEGVFVEINDISVAQIYDQWDEWHVDDGSGSCIIVDAIFSLREIGFPLFIGYPFSSIKGVVSYSYNKFMLHPRSIDDIQSFPGAYIFSVNDYSVNENTEFEYSVLISFLGLSEVDSYEFILQYDNSIIEYNSYSQNGNLSSNGTVYDTSIPGEVHLVFNGTFSFSGIEEMITLKFIPVSAGSSLMTFTSGVVNGNSLQYLANGHLDINVIGDTLTVIQKPLLNIPEIVVPGESFEIICTAPSNSSNWQAQLIHNNYTVDLPILGSIFNTDLERWYLTATAPNPDIYELFDLKVSATGISDDITTDAVQIIPQEKDSYYFIHITDTHLPTHIFYPDPQSETDTSELTDLREVINDINLINPEFVLLTGDFINEGELEDFENRRVYSKAQRMLTEFDVPVYLVTGNHDIGGWLDTPPPNGTARHNWWRFFGWPWLIDPPPSEPYYTQDYSFDYGPVHFVGLESYDNYDGYMYSVYGEKSFIPSQLTWLDNDLQNSIGSESKVLFYHFDFTNQINLSSLGVDMALYGHIHNNSGDINIQPYDLATDNICDGTRAYRIIRVNDGELQPFNTVYSEGNGENLVIEFSPANNGTADSVVAQITNNHDMEFEHAQIKFVMPKGNFSYSVINGVLDQVDSSGDYAVCYVNVNIPANDIITVHIMVNLPLDLFVDIKAMLEGPFNGIDMNTFIVDDLPLTQPYNLSPWNYNGTETVTSIPSNVVDWILIEIRDANDAASATSATTVSRQAAFIKTDGTIVSLDGISMPQFFNTPANHFFAVIWHRNHIGIISADPLTESGGIYVYDFTDNVNKAYGGTEAQNELAPGVWGMIGADGDANGIVGMYDKDEWTNQAGLPGYKSADYNLNGEVENKDKNDIWLPSLGTSVQIPGYFDLPTEGLVAHYPFDGDAMDVSGNGNNGQPYGGVNLNAFDRTGNPNSASQYDGGNDYIWLGENPALQLPNFSICSWFKSTQSSGYRMIYRWRWYGVSILLDYGYIRAEYIGISTSHSLNSNNNLADGNWHFVIFTYDGSYLKLYIDGQEVDSDYSEVPVYYGGGGAAIGRDGDYNAFFFDGYIDDVRIYNKALNSTEINQLFYEPK